MAVLCWCIASISGLLPKPNSRSSSLNCQPNVGFRILIVHVNRQQVQQIQTDGDVSNVDFICNIRTTVMRVAIAIKQSRWLAKIISTVCVVQLLYTHTDFVVQILNMALNLSTSIISNRHNVIYTFAFIWLFLHFSCNTCMFFFCCIIRSVFFSFACIFKVSEFLTFRTVPYTILVLYCQKVQLVKESMRACCIASLAE